MEATPALDTLKKVAAKSGVGFGTVQRAKNGNGNVTVQNLSAIAAAFRRHPAELMIEPEKKEMPLLYAGTVIEGTATRLAAQEPPAAEIRAFPAPLLRELQEVAERINDTGLQRLIERANSLAEQFPKAVDKGNAAS